MLRNLIMPLGVTLMLAVAPVQAMADANTSHSIANQIGAELTLIHDANGTVGGADARAPELAVRQPRHNLQKAREVWLKVQEVRAINGLPESHIPAFPAAEVQSSDVTAILEAILADVQALRPVFGVIGAVTPSAGSSGKTPTDVYAELTAVSLQLDGLGIPKISGREVFQVVRTLQADLKHLASARGAAIPGDYHGADGMKPKDVYARVFEVSEQLQALVAQNPELAIDGGIVPLNRRSGKIIPAHVLDLLNNVLADVNAMKAAAGVQQASELAPQDHAHGGHINPNIVHDGVSTALMIAQSMS